jgi:hypothetical protein
MDGRVDHHILSTSINTDDGGCCKPFPRTLGPKMPMDKFYQMSLRHEG